MEGTNGLFEVRVQLGSNIFRIFCFFDGNKFVILLTSFQKKTQKTPSKEIEKAKRLMTEYYNEKEKDKKNEYQNIRPNKDRILRESGYT